MFQNIKLITSMFFILFGLVNASPEYKPIEELDISSYIGRWYQVYGNNFDKVFERGDCAVADYGIINSNNISVLNTQVYKGEQDNITGNAYYTDDNYGGELTVKLDGQGEAPYWVIELGPIVNNQYDYSIVSDNLKLSLFVLARNVEEYYKYYNDKVQKSLQNFGFTNKINKPVQTNQTDCTYYFQ